ncbi:MAG TPA: hypothetical protein VGO40_04055, partial [Longimicrobium sp.]|nr:hypothetical protein [Longimicrobium sp.]
MNLSETAIYQRLHVLAAEDRQARVLLVHVDHVFDEARDIARTMVRFLPEYTLHDDTHLVAVVDLMGRLLPEKTLAALQPLELTALILAAGLHDVGMTPTEEEAQELRSAEDTAAPTARQIEYRRFRAKHPDIVRRAETLAAAGRARESEEVNGYLLAEFLRITHGERADRVIRERFRADCQYGDVNFTDQLAAVCRSHTEGITALEALPVYDLVRPGGEFCNWRFVAVLLRLADVLDFDAKRTPAALFRHLGVRTPVSVREWRKHQQVKAWDIRPGRVAFRADCEDPIIQETVSGFLTMIEDELRLARSVVAAMHDPRAPEMHTRYWLELPADVDSSQVGPAMGPDGPVFRFLPVRFRLDHDAITQILMGLALYGHRSLFLRELLQNAVDACRHRVAAGDRDYEPSVAVRLAQDEEGQPILQVEDNGMGMSLMIVERYFARIGQSYYRSPDFRAEALANPSFRPISQFGIGVLSAFMAGDRLRVQTRYAGAGAKPLSIEVADQGALFWFRTGDRADPGTVLSVRLSQSVAALFPVTARPNEEPLNDLERLSRAIQDLAPHVEIPIWCEVGGKHLKIDGSFSLREFYTDPVL